jgi:hypothetical protein
VFGTKLFQFLFETVPDSGEKLEFDLAGVVFGHREVIVLLVQLLADLLEPGLELGVEVLELDAFKLGGHFLLGGFPGEGQHLVHLHLVLLEGNAVGVVQPALHHAAAAALLLQQLNVALPRLPHFLLEGTDGLLELQDLLLVLFLPLEDFLLEFLDKFLIDCAVLVEHQFLSGPDKHFVLFEQLAVELFVFLLQLLEEVLGLDGPVFIVHEGGSECLVLGHQVVVGVLELADRLLELVDFVVAFVLVLPLDGGVLDDHHEFLLGLGGELHDAGDELGLDGALYADDEDQVQQSLEALFGFALGHFYEVHVGEVLGQGHFGVPLQEGGELLVDGLQPIVVLLPVDGVRCLVGEGEPLDWRQQLFQQLAVFDVVDLCELGARGRLQPEQQGFFSPLHRR